MKVFSQSPKGYLEVWKWSFVALFVVGLLRFFMAPMGIPIETGGKVVSLTVVLLVALVGYTAYFGWSGGKLGEHLIAHVQATFFGGVIGSVLGGIAFGVAWLARWATKRRALSLGAAS